MVQAEALRYKVQSFLSLHSLRVRQSRLTPIILFAMQAERDVALAEVSALSALLKARDEARINSLSPLRQESPPSPRDSGRLSPGGDQTKVELPDGYEVHQEIECASQCKLMIQLTVDVCM